MYKLCEVKSPNEIVETLIGYLKNYNKCESELTTKVLYLFIFTAACMNKVCLFFNIIPLMDQAK